MFKLLVNSPAGMQEIVFVDAHGGYFDNARVLWDERTDGPMPAVDPGKMQRIGNQLVMLNDYLPEHVAALLKSFKAAKIAELKTAFDAENYADIDHDNKTWRADKASQQLLSDVLAPGSVPVGMYWRDAVETQHAMTFADLQALGRAMLDRGLILDNKFETKKAAVIAAQSIEAVNAIVWEDQ